MIDGGEQERKERRDQDELHCPALDGSHSDVEIRRRVTGEGHAFVTKGGEGDGRAKHDAIVSAIKSTARGQYGLITSTGRLIRLESLDLPAVPTTANAPNLQGGAPVAEFVSLEPGEKALALTGRSLRGWLSNMPGHCKNGVCPSRSVLFI